MSVLSSSSTDTQVQSAYDDNASYAEDVSVSKCRAFITACRILARRLPSTAVKGGNSISLRDLQDQEKRAQDWLEAHSTEDGDRPGPSRTYADFRYNR